MSEYCGKLNWHTWAEGKGFFLAMMTGCELSLSSVVPISVYSAQPSSERHLRPLCFVSHHFEHKNPEEVQPWEIFCYVGGLQKQTYEQLKVVLANI